MKYQHNGLEFEINDKWLAEAKVLSFEPHQDSYTADKSHLTDEDVFYIPVQSISPLIERAREIGVFCDDRETGETAKQRVLRILEWLRENEPIEPIKVVPLNNSSFKYKLVAGCHRFYCAIALGYLKVPAALGFDINDPNA